MSVPHSIHFDDKSFYTLCSPSRMKLWISGSASRVLTCVLFATVRAPATTSFSGYALLRQPVGGSSATSPWLVTLFDGSVLCATRTSHRTPMFHTHERGPVHGLQSCGPFSAAVWGRIHSGQWRCYLSPSVPCGPGPFARWRQMFRVSGIICPSVRTQPARLLLSRPSSRNAVSSH